jgi:hypothetical protein
MQLQDDPGKDEDLDEEDEQGEDYESGDDEDDNIEMDETYPPLLPPQIGICSLFIEHSYSNVIYRSMFS